MARPSRTVYSFPGEPEVQFMGICHDCNQAQPFLNARSRDEWVDDHRTSHGHQITKTVEVHTGLARVECTMNFQGEVMKR